MFEDRMGERSGVENERFTYFAEESCHIVSLGTKENYHYTLKKERISKSCEITQANNLNRRRRLSRKAQCLTTAVGKVIKILPT